MKTLLLLFTFLFCQSIENDCKSFYEKNLPDEIYGKVIEKKEEPKNYLIKIDDSLQEKQIEIFILKNKTGKEIFKFIQKESIIKKRKGQLGVSILTPMKKGGGFEGHAFPDLCN